MAVHLVPGNGKRKEPLRFRQVRQTLGVMQSELFQAPMEIPARLLQEIIEQRVVLECTVSIRFNDADGEHVSQTRLRNKIGKWDGDDRLIALHEKPTFASKVARVVKKIVWP